MTAQQEAVIVLRSKLWQNGFRPISVYSPGAVEWTGQPIASAGKRPNRKNWHESALASVPDACTAKPSLDALNTGILCDSLLAVDIDVDSPAIVAQIEAAALHFLGQAPKRVRSNSARVLMLYRASEGEPSKRSIAGTNGKVESLGFGQQFVAFGQHPSGAAYEWPQGSPAEFGKDALTAVTADALQAFLCAVTPLVGADTPTQPSAAPAGLSVASVPSQVTDRDRNYGASTLEAIGCKLDLMQPGSGRNNAINSGSHSAGTLVGNGSVPYDVAKARLILSAERNGHTAKHGIAQTIATIESGLNAGMNKPRSLLSEDADSPALEIARQSCRNLLATYKAKLESKNQSAPANGKRSITLVQCSTIEAKPITWIWSGFIPQNKLTLLAGAGGTGKSTLAFNFAATVSNAGMWPDGSRCNAAGNVLIWSSEDDASDTVLPRLEHFPLYCRPSTQSLNHALALSGEISKSASVIA